MPQETENVSVVKSIKGGDSNAVKCIKGEGNNAVVKSIKGEGSNAVVKSIKGEGSNTVVKSIKGEGSNAVVKQHDKQHKPNEIIDIESVQCTTLNDGPEPWLSFSRITLTIIDQDLIIQGKKLNDKHLNFAQAILKKQCAHLNGLHSTLLLFRMKEALSNCKDVIQMIHTRDSCFNSWLLCRRS